MDFQTSKSNNHLQSASVQLQQTATGASAATPRSVHRHVKQSQINQRQLLTNAYDEGGNVGAKSDATTAMGFACISLQQTKRAMNQIMDFVGTRDKKSTSKFICMGAMRSVHRNTNNDPRLLFMANIPDGSDVIRFPSANLQQHKSCRHQ